MPKAKKKSKIGKIIKNQGNPLFVLRKKGKKLNVLPKTKQDVQISEQKSQDKYSTINCIPQNTNTLSTKQDLESAAKLFAEFKQTYLNGDVGFIWVRDQTKDKFNKYRITSGQLINRIVDESKGIVKGIKQVYNIEYRKGGEIINQNNVVTFPLAGFLNDSSNFIIQVNNKKLKKQDLFNRFNKFKSTVLSASDNNEGIINKLIYDICGLLTPIREQNNETVLETFNYRVQNIEGVVFESERGNRGGLITFISGKLHS